MWKHLDVRRLSTEAGRIHGYEFRVETWAGDGSAHKVHTGSVCHQQPERHLVVRVGGEEEGISSLRPELAAVALKTEGHTA